jgi:hypothetical protein
MPAVQGSLKSSSCSTRERPPGTADFEEDHHWSDLVPLVSALTFSAIWDSEDGMVTFSVSELQHSPDCKSAHLPLDFHDGRSQVQTIAESIASENTATLAVFCDNSPYYRATTPNVYGCPLASSTWGGYDACLRHSWIATGRRRCSQYYSCFDALDDEIGFDPHTAFAHIPVKIESALDKISVSDEGFYEAGARMPSASSDDDLVFLELNLVRLCLCPCDSPKRCSYIAVQSSAFSTTTTSTSNYVDVEEDAASDTWSALETPIHLSCPNSPPNSTRRRLRKRRRTDSPVLPVDDLERNRYNHAHAPDHRTLHEDAKKPVLLKFVRRLGKWKMGRS